MSRGEKVLIVTLVVGGLLLLVALTVDWHGRAVRLRAAAELTSDLAAGYAQTADCTEAMGNAIAAARLAGGAGWNEQTQAQALRSLAWSAIYANVCGGMGR